MMESELSPFHANHMGAMIAETGIWCGMFSNLLVYSYLPPPRSTKWYILRKVGFFLKL
jgi:hypothetical protein